MEEVIAKQPHQRAGRDDVATYVSVRTAQVGVGAAVEPVSGLTDHPDVQSRQHRDVSVKQDYNVELRGQSGRWETTAERQRRYDELLAMIEGSSRGLSGHVPASTSVVVGNPGPGETQPRSVEMTSTMSTTSEFHVESDPPTLQIRDQRRGVRTEKDSSLGRTPSPDISVLSSESEVSPTMRMELRQKRRVIEEVAVYDSRTFYENQSPKRSRHRDDRSPSSAAVRVEPAISVEHPVVQVSPTTVHIQPEPTPSTSEPSEHPSRTFAVTGSIQLPEDIEKVDVVEQEAPVVVTCVATVVECPPGTISQGSGANTSVTYIVHHAMPGKMAPGDVLFRRNDEPYRDLRTDLAETPSLDIRKKGKLTPREYGPVLETVTYVVCYQMAGPDERGRNIINELYRPNYTITGRIGPTSSIEDTADSYTLPGLSGGPPPYSEEQESLYLAILNYAARSQDNWHREMPGNVTCITQQDFPKATDRNTLSLSRKGPTVEAKESPPPTPTSDDDEIWVKQKVVVVKPVQAEVELPTTTADVFSEAMEIVQHAEADVDVSSQNIRTEYRGWRRDDEVEVKRPATDVVMPRYEVEVCAEVSADDKKELFPTAEASPADEVVVSTSVYRPDYRPDEVEFSDPWVKSSTQFTYQATVETPEATLFSDAKVPTTRAYVFHEQLPTTDVKSSGPEPVISEVDANTPPVSAYVKVTTTGSDTLSRTYVVHREWPSLKPTEGEWATLDSGAHYGTLTEALASTSSTTDGDTATRTYIVRYDWPTIAKPTADFDVDMGESREAVGVAELQTASTREDVPRMYVVQQRESPPPKATPTYGAAVAVEKEVGISVADAGHDAASPIIESPENSVSYVYIVRRDWPQLKIAQPEIGRDVNVRHGNPISIGFSPTGDVTTRTYLAHYDWPAMRAARPIRQRPASDVICVPPHLSVTDGGEAEVTETPKPRVTFAPAVMETDLDIVSPFSYDVDTTPEITHEVRYEQTKEPTAAVTASAADIIKVETAEVRVRVPEISVATAGPDEVSYRVETSYDSDLERDWPWFKADSPAVRQETTVPDIPHHVAVEVASGSDFYVNKSTEVPSRELMTKTYIVRRNWPEITLELASRTMPDIGLSGALIPDTHNGDITSQTYVVDYEWPPAKTKPMVKDGRTDITTDISASMSAEDAAEMSPTYLARTDRSRVKIHLPGPDRSREAEVEVIPVEPDDEPSAPSPAVDNIVSRTYIVHHDFPRVRLLLSDPKPDITDDIYTSRQLDMVTYIVYCDWPSKKAKKPIIQPPEMVPVDMPGTDVDLSVRENEVDTSVDLLPRTADYIPAVRVCPPVSRHVEFEQPAVEVVATVEPEVEVRRLRLETDIDEVLRSGEGDFAVHYDITAPKIQKEMEPIHVRQPAIVVIEREPEDDRRLRFETDIDLPAPEPVAATAAAADVDISVPVTYTRDHRDEGIEPPSITIIPPSGDVVAYTYIVHHDWPRVKLTLSEPKRRLDIGLHVESDEADRQLASRTYIVYHDWPSLKIQAPATGPPGRIVIEERKGGTEVAVQDEGEVNVREPVPAVVFHYDVPAVEIQEPQPVRIPEPSVEVTATTGADITDVEARAAVAAPTVTFIDARPEAGVTVSRESAPSGELISHTYIVHHDWPRVKLILPEPKKTLLIHGAIDGEDDTEYVPRTLERKTYIVHYDSRTKRTEKVEVIPQHELFEEPEPPAIAVCPMSAASVVKTRVEESGEEVSAATVRSPEVTVTQTALKDEVPEREKVKYVVEYQTGAEKGKQPTEELTTVSGVTTKVIPPTSLEAADRGEDTVPPSTAVIAPYGDVLTHTYIVHHDWPRVTLTLSKPKTRLDAGLHVKPDVETDRQLVSATYIVHYDWPSLEIKTIQPTEASAMIAIERPESDVEVTVRGEADIDVDTRVREQLPSIVVQYEVPKVHIEEPEPVQMPEPTVKMITEPSPEPQPAVEIPLRAVVDVDVDVIVSESFPSSVVQHDILPTVEIQEPEPVRIPEPVVRTVSEPGPEVDWRFRYETDIDLAVAEPVTHPAAAANVLIAETDVGASKDEGGKPKISIVAPSDDVVIRTYIVHHDWPTVKLSLSEPKRRLDAESTVVFRYDVPSVEIQEPQPICDREASIEVTATGSADVTDAEIGATVAAPTVIFIRAGHETDVTWSRETAPSGEFTSRTYVVHHDWPRVKLTIPEPKKALLIHGAISSEDDTEYIPRTLERKTYIVHYDLATKGTEEVAVIPQHEILEEPQLSAIAVCPMPAASVVETHVEESGEEVATATVRFPEVTVTQTAIRDEVPEGEKVKYVVEYQTGAEKGKQPTEELTTVSGVTTVIPPTSLEAADRGEGTVSPSTAVIAPYGDVLTHTYIVHHDWPRVTLTLSKPKTRLDAELHVEPDVETDRQLVSATYIVHYDWPSLKIKAIQPTEASAMIAIERPESDIEVTVRGEADIDVDTRVREQLPSIVVQYEVPKVHIEEPEPVQMPEPTVKMITEPAPEPEPVMEMPSRVGVDVDVDVTVSEPFPGAIVQHEILPTVEIQEPEPVRIPEPVVRTITEPEPEVDWKLRYETDIDVAVTEPVAPPAAAYIVPVAVTCVDEGKDEDTEPTIAIIATSEDIATHTYIVHHDWPKIKLTLPGPKATLTVSGLADIAESVSAPSRKVISLTYIVNWPSVKGKPSPKAEAGFEIQEPTTEPASVEVRIDEEPRPSTDIHVVSEPTVPEVEVIGAVPIPDVPSATITIADEEKIVAPAAVSVSVATGDVISRTYIVHRDWPRVKLVTPEPKKSLISAAREDDNADKIARTYIVRYDWPAIQVKGPSEPELPAGAAIQAIDSGTDVSGEVHVGVAKPASKKVTQTYIVHYDWPAAKDKLEKQSTTGELEIALTTQPEVRTSAVDVSVDQPEIMRPSPEIFLEISQPEEPVSVETVVVTVPDVGEPEPTVPAGEITWQIPVTDVTVEPFTFDIKPRVDIEAEPAVCTVGEVITAGVELEIEPSPLVVETTVDVPPTTVVETKHVEPPVTGEATTFVVDYELVKAPVTIAQPTAEVRALKDEVISTEILKKEPQEDVFPETITYVVTYDVSKKQAGKPSELAVKVERRPSSDEEARIAKPQRPEVEVSGAEEGPSGEVLVVTPAARIAEEETVKYVVEYRVDVAEGKFPRLFMKKVSKVPSLETPKVVLAPEVEGGIAAEGHGIPVQTQISETVNVDYEAVKITAPAVIVEGSVQAPDVVLSPPYEERPEVAVAAVVAASAPSEPSEPSAALPEGETVTYIVHYDLVDVGVARGKKLKLSLTRKDKEAKPEEVELAATGPEAGIQAEQPSKETMTYVVTYDYSRAKKPSEPVVAKPSTPQVTVDESIDLPRLDIEKHVKVPAAQDAEVVSVPAASAIVEVQPSPGLEGEIVCIREPEIELPEVSPHKEVLVVHPSFEVESRGEIEVAEFPTVEGVEEAEKVVPQPAEVSIELEKPVIDISIQPPDVEIPKPAAELRVGPAPEVEVEVPAVETVQEATAPPETETITFIVHYDEPLIGAKPSPDDYTVSLKKKRRASGDEVRVLLRPLHEPLAADDVTPASGLQSLRHLVVVAIDIGTTFSGYAFTLTGKAYGKNKQDDDDDGHQQPQQQRPSAPLEPSSVTVMRRLEPGDPGVVNHKSPTSLLLDPDGEFHSFGFTARDFYHDLSPREAKKWLYFDKFKMALHNAKDLDVNTEIPATNGQRMLAMTVFAHALSFFRSRALLEIRDQSGSKVANDDIRWMITVPAIWHEPAKEFMRLAAYQAGLASEDRPEQLVISLEPEAASIFVRRQHLHQLVGQDEIEHLAFQRPRSPRPGRTSVSPEPLQLAPSRPPTEHVAMHSELTGVTLTTTTIRWSFRRHASPTYVATTVADQVDIPGTRYMVVDCGGGTIDITVHELVSLHRPVAELHKICGAPFGSTEVDAEFERLLVAIFGQDFMDVFKAKRPAGWVDLMMAFESRKRATNPFRNKPLHVSLPFSFIDCHKKYRNSPVETAVRYYGDRDVTWTSQGMLRLSARAMRRLFQPTLEHIKQLIGNVLNESSLRGIKFMFLVGGFADSPMLQTEVRNEFQHVVKIIIPNEVSLAVLRGAVCFGVDPILRRAVSTYAVAVTRPFVRGRDPQRKLLRRDRADWCLDALDVLVHAGQQVCLGETVVRRYSPAAVVSSSRRARSPSPVGASSSTAVFDVYRSVNPEVRYTSDTGVSRCGSLALELDQRQDVERSGATWPTSKSIVELSVCFGSEAMRLCAVDTTTGRCARTTVEFACQ